MLDDESRYAGTQALTYIYTFNYTTYTGSLPYRRRRSCRHCLNRIGATNDVDRGGVFSGPLSLASEPMEIRLCRIVKPAKQINAEVKSTSFLNSKDSHKTEPENERGGEAYRTYLQYTASV